jgi:hypothetical protein
VKFCETKALQYVEATTVNMKKSRDSAKKFSEMLQKLGQEQRR